MTKKLTDIVNEALHGPNRRQNGEEPDYAAGTVGKRRDRSRDILSMARAFKDSGVFEVHHVEPLEDEAFCVEPKNFTLGLTRVEGISEDSAEDAIGDLLLKTVRALRRGALMVVADTEAKQLTTYEFREGLLRELSTAGAYTDRADLNPPSRPAFTP